MPTKRNLSIADLDQVVLKSGGHDRRSLDSLCVMEAVAWFAGREHTDRPPCVSPIIAELMRKWNDSMNDDDRQMLKPLIPRVVNTVASSEIELQRSYLALDWSCRVSTPAWLRLAGLTAEADAVEATAPITDSASAKAAQRALDQARDAASAARSAAWSAARSAAWSAAGSAARSAAWSAAWSAAESAAASAAASAARSAAGSAARSAAASAAESAMRPTVEALQASALDLIDQMIALTTTEVQP